MADVNGPTCSKTRTLHQSSAEACGTMPGTRGSGGRPGPQRGPPEHPPEELPLGRTSGPMALLMPPMQCHCCGLEVLKLAPVLSLTATKAVTGNWARRHFHRPLQGGAHPGSRAALLRLPGPTAGPSRRERGQLRQLLCNFFSMMG